MFTQPAPSPPTLATTTSPVSPASPQRPSRLRGLSYLRTYTQNHLHSRDSSNNDGQTSPRRLNFARGSSFPSFSSQATFVNRQDSIYTPTATSHQSGATGEDYAAVGGQIGVVQPALQAELPPIPDESNTTSSVGGEVVTSSDMARTRSTPAIRTAVSETTQVDGVSEAAPQAATTSGSQLPSIRFSQHQDVRAPRPSLTFSPMGRTLPTGKEIIRVGRYSERDAQPNPAANVPSAAPVGFKSKVVSRRHCEFWCENGQWFIKDVKSSSGTFLNHVRLSSPGTESKPYPVKDGDIVQLGIDFKGGEEMIFRCVKIRVELNRGWQSSLNSFNVMSHKRLRNMAKQLTTAGGSTSQDCTICLGPVAPCQSLFVAPCSHTWHYKCVRRIINGPTWPTFICPNCRAVADLEADVEDPFPGGQWEEDFAESEADPANGTGAPQMNDVPSLRVQDAERLDAPPAYDSIHQTPEGTPESESDILQAMNQFSMGVQNENAAPAPHSLTGPVEIRAGRPSARNEISSTTGGFADNHGNSSRNGRTPSPHSRAPSCPDVISGQDGPLTPRNDAGPFVFDGSAGRARGRQVVSALDLSDVIDTHNNT